MTQQKTGKHLMIPVTHELAEAINAAAPSEHVVFLVNEDGRAFTPERFTKWFVKQCERIGLEGLSPHGLRKASCRRLAEAGCSANEIAAISRAMPACARSRDRPRRPIRRAWPATRWSGCGTEGQR